MRKKRIIRSMILVICSLSLGISIQACHSLKTNTVAMVLPFTDYEVSEFRIPQKILNDAGYSIRVASTELGVARAGSDTVEVDLLLNDLDAKQFDAVIFVGGQGVESLLNNDVALRAARAAMKEKKIVAAICWAPIILANAGVLQGKDAIASTQFKKITDQGGKLVFKDVVMDGNIVTANGPSAAKKFGETVLALLKER